LDEAYRRLGLTDLDDFLETRSGERDIGASTWMCVEAVLGMTRGRSSMVVAHAFDRAKWLFRKAHGYALRLGFEPGQGMAADRRVLLRHHLAFLVPPEPYKETHTWKMSPCLGFVAVPKGTAHVTAPYDVAATTSRPCDVYIESVWRQRTISRMAGPFAAVVMVKAIDGVDGQTRYFSFDGPGKFLMELPEAGVKSLQADNPHLRVQRIHLPSNQDLIKHHGGKTRAGALQNVYEKLGIPRSMIA